MIGTPEPADGEAALDQRLHLRHAEAGRDARRAAAARADADLDAVGAAIDQEPRAFGGRDVAGDHLHVGETLAELAHRAVHHDRMAVRDVDDQDVDLRPHQLRGALEVVAGRADRRADHQAALRIARGERPAPLPDEILRRHQPGARRPRRRAAAS